MHDPYLRSLLPWRSSRRDEVDTGDVRRRADGRRRAVRATGRGEKNFEYPPAWVPWGAEPDFFRVDMEIERK
jgi:hypothetical protein